jgi:hypothetical protein
MKYEKVILANAFALTTVVLWVLCTLVVAIFPDFSLSVTKWWMHGMNIFVMGSWNLDVTNVLFGGITLAISAWVTGYVLGWSFEIVGKK